MGVKLARERSAAMKRLLHADPEEFVRQSLPDSAAAQLPSEVKTWVEKRIRKRGMFGVYCDLPAQETPESEPYYHGGFRREVTVDGVTYTAHVFGGWRDQTTLSDTEIDGVVLDNEIAIGDTPTPEDSTGSDPGWTADAPTTGGRNTVLYMIARFSDQTNDPVSASTALSHMTVVSNFWMNNSYGQVYIQGLVNTNQPVDLVYITLPQPASYASTYNGSLSSILTDARTAANAQGFNYADYNLDAVVTTGSGFSYAGRAYVGGQGAHLVSSYTSLRTAGHELGHNLGLWHANYWRSDSTKPFGKDSVPGGYVADSNNAEWVEYGHYCSVMSAQSGGEMDDATKPHYAAVEKMKLGWLTGARVQYVTTNGAYRLYRHDHRDVTNNPRGIRIETPATDYTGSARRFWLNYRYAPWTTAQNWLRNGVQIDVAKTSYSSDGAVMLDATPFSYDAASPFFDPASKPSSYWTIDNNDKKDGALILGRTFSDQTAGIHITPVGLGSSGTNQEYVDVVINLGTFPSNSAPVITSFTATADQVNTGQNVTFSVDATDPNGDPLAYAWDFDQVQVWTASGLNTNSATKNWSSTGQYRVMVTVSDMKGGVATETILVTVGSPSANRQIFGRVLRSGQPVAGARIFSGSFQCFSETDGSYALNDLSATSLSLTCRADGLTFTAQFTNPVSVVTANSYGKDFYANEVLPGLGRLAVLPYEIPVAAGTTYPFAVQAWATNGNPISVLPTWTAVGGAIDSNGVYTADIPGGPYPIVATSGSLSATGWVQVTGIALPVVTVEMPGGFASEAGLEPAVLRFRRTGPINAALGVQFSLGGTATPAADYTVTGASSLTGTEGTVTIPAGADTADLVFTPVDDLLVETAESINLTVVDALSYNPGAVLSASIALADNEVQSILVATNVLSVVEGGSVNLGVRLAFEPAADVTVTTALVGGDMDLDVYGGASLTFTPADWNVTQDVILFAQQDLDAAPDIALFAVSSPGASDQLVTLGAVDDDVLAIAVSTNLLHLVEGTTNFVTIQLTAQPTNDMTVTVVSDPDHPNVSLTSSGSLVFTPLNWEMPQTLWIVAASAAGSTNQTATFLLTSSECANVPLAILVAHQEIAVPLQINVAAVDPNASEFGGRAGVLAISSHSATNLDTAIGFVVSGTASNGVDYAFLTNYVTLQGGATNLEISIMPIPDNLAEGDETVVITLVAGAGYSLGDSTNALITLHDRPYDAWRFGNFTGAELDDPAVAGNEADPDGDGICNLLEYAFALEPKLPDAAGRPAGYFNGDYFEMKYRQNKAAVDLQFLPEGRNQLESSDWSSAGLSESARADQGAFYEVTVRDSAGVTNAPQRFLRLNVTPR